MLPFALLACNLHIKLQDSAKRWFLGCVNSLPGSAWLWLSKQLRLFADPCTVIAEMAFNLSNPSDVVLPLGMGNEIGSNTNPVGLQAVHSIHDRLQPYLTQPHGKLPEQRLRRFRRRLLLCQREREFNLERAPFIFKRWRSSGIVMCGGIVLLLPLYNAAWYK